MLLQKHRVELHLVNRLELLRDGKDGLDVVVAQLLDQVSDGRIVLRSRDVGVTTKATNGKLIKGKASSYSHSSGSLCTCCSPGGISRRWAERCRPACRRRRSGSRHRWRTPADGSHSSSRSCPGKQGSKHSHCSQKYTASVKTESKNLLVKHQTTPKVPFFTHKRVYWHYFLPSKRHNCGNVSLN